MELLASNDFQEGLKNYRDLDFLSRKLDAGVKSMATYRDMLAVRRQGFAERLPRTIAGERALHLERLRADYLQRPAGWRASKARRIPRRSRGKAAHARGAPRARARGARPGFPIPPCARPRRTNTGCCGAC